MDTKINFQVQTDQIVNSLDGRKTILLHSCCGPCSTYVTEYLSEFFEIYIYYYNPNIYPKEEYIKRLQTQIKFLDASKIANLQESNYDHDEFLKNVRGFEQEKEGGARCEKCFRLRLEKTAEKAKDIKADYFGTTLTVSPHKNADIINRIGLELQEKYGVPFLLADFKKRDGYKKSIVLSKEYDLYRQNYCGCEFSINNTKE